MATYYVLWQRTAPPAQESRITENELSPRTEMPSWVVKVERWVEFCIKPPRKKKRTNALGTQFGHHALAKEKKLAHEIRGKINITLARNCVSRHQNIYNSSRLPQIVDGA